MIVVVKCTDCGRPCEEAKISEGDSRPTHACPLMVIHVTLPKGWTVTEADEMFRHNAYCPRCTREQQKRVKR